MDFLKLVQKKENKLDNGIIIFSAIVLFSVIAGILLWPQRDKTSLVSYLPADTSFYLQFSDFKKQWSDDKRSEYPFLDQSLEEHFTNLENILASNYLNLEEVVIFQLDREEKVDNYLLRFSRLPKSFVSDGQNISQDFNLYSLDKNVLLIAYQDFDYKTDYDKKEVLFDRPGLNLYWQKEKIASWLKEVSYWLEPLYTDNEIFVNLSLDNKNTRVFLLQNTTSDLKSTNSFIMPADFDIAFGFFNNDLQNELPIKEIIKSLPYTNISQDWINNRLLTDSLYFAKGESWILASYNDWVSDWSYLLSNVKLEEKNRSLSDGTVYVELLASADQGPQKHEINGQELWQIDNLWAWSIGDRHYLSNDRQMMENITSRNVYLDKFFANCMDKQAILGDFLYIDKNNQENSALKQFLIDNNLEKLQITSYSSSTYQGLGLCF